MQTGKDVNRGAAAATSFIVGIVSELKRATGEVEDAQNTLQSMKTLPPNLQEMLGRAIKHLKRAAEIMSAVIAFIEDDVINNNEMLATIAVTIAEEMVNEAEELARRGDIVMARERLVGAMAIKELGDIPWLEWKINDLMNRIKQLLEQLQTTAEH